MIKSQEKYMRQLSLVMLGLGLFYLIISEDRVGMLWFFFLSVAFDIRSHLYRIQDDIKNK